MNIKQALNYATIKFKKISINSASLDARVLLQYASNRTIEYLLSRCEDELTEFEQITFENFVSRRLNLEPIAYIIGCKEFYGYEFIVTNKVLIPREDTEILVDAVLKEVALVNICHPEYNEGSPPISGDSSASSQNDRTNVQNDTPLDNNFSNIYNILELGTGSSCIAISLLLEIPNSNVIATDISHDAILVASQNAAKHKITNRMKIIHSNWFDNIEKMEFDFIISNPPYISAAERSYMAHETLAYEPYLALFGGNNGLQSYYAIAENATKFLKQDGKLFVEIGFNQAELVSKIFNDYGYTVNKIYKDLAGHERVLVIKI